MKSKPPADRRKFRSDWDQVGYLHDKLLYWLYAREDAGKARPYAKRLEKLLSRVASDHEAILGEECWSLVHETKGDLAKAIQYRTNEIRFIRRLQEISRNTPFEHYALKGYGYDDLSGRLDLLAVLYHDSGQLDKAIRTLRESEGVCHEHGLVFDGKDLLQESLEEQGATATSGPSRSLPA
jgi:tetratricopeptide (TPR) repeat protein